MIGLALLVIIAVLLSILVMYTIIKHWCITLCVFGLLTLMASCGHAADNSTAVAEVAVLVDASTIDRATIERTLTEASTVMRQAGITLTLVSYDVQQVATHTNPRALLDSLKSYRIARSGDIYVLFTERKLAIGATPYAGIATTGPACDSSASAVVQLRYDGTDAVTLAHEIAHTFGAEDDKYGGYLMDIGTDSPDPRFPAGATDTMSPDTLGVLRGAYLDCMVSAPTVKSVPSGTTGGAGAMDCWFIVALLVLVIALQAYKLYERKLTIQDLAMRLAVALRDLNSRTRMLTRLVDQVKHTTRD